MNYNTRESSILVENKMETLFKLEKFPISVSCVPDNFSDEKYLDMEFQICKKTGIIQIKNYPFLDDMYPFPHNSSYGKVWNDLFELMSGKISDLISKINEPKILEIGGGALKLASKILEKNKKIKKYIVYEKNSSKYYTDDRRIELNKEYFTEDTKINENIDVILHSHV